MSPLTLVAFADTLPIGSASLVECDLPSHQHLTPWLASLFVATPYQKQGIGGKLVQQIESIAANMSYQQLYLFTWTAAYYHKLGWKAIALYSVRRIARISSDAKDFKSMKCEL